MSRISHLKKVTMIFMNWIDRAISLLVVSASSVLAFFFVEYSYRFIMEHSTANTHRNLTMLFEVGKNFVNYDGYFKYYPEVEIRSLALFSKDYPRKIEDVVVEYDYKIRTNNAGLVMQSKLKKNDIVVFVIGDSFTEGQGASPWFYDLENSYKIYPWKLVNLGIIGTGPMQWKNLADSIADEFDLTVAGAVVNIIPDDMRRGVWNFHEREISCLSQLKCDYDFGFQGYSFRPEQSHDDIRHMLLERLNTKSFNSVKDYIKRSHVIYDVYKFFRDYRNRNVPHAYSVGSQPNEEALLALRAVFGGKFFVNVVSEKHINSQNFLRHDRAKLLVEFLNANAINYSWCDIPINGFNVNDLHPNQHGYEILRECTREALTKIAM